MTQSPLERFVELHHILKSQSHRDGLISSHEQEYQSLKEQIQKSIEFVEKCKGGKGESPVSFDNLWALIQNQHNDECRKALENTEILTLIREYCKGKETVEVLKLMRLGL